MNRRTFLKLMAGAGITAASCGFWPLPAKCFGRTTELPRLVLLYATCTVNKSCLSPYNPTVTYTPNLEKFAAGAAVFKNCQAECGQSGTAYAALFSGNQADVHGIFSHPTRIDDAVPLITRSFADHGYDVFFWGGHPMADYKLNYGQGTREENAFPYLLYAEDPAFDRILKRLAVDQNYRVFILTTFSVTHAPYYPALPPYPTYPFDALSVRQSEKFYGLNMIGPEFEKLDMKIPEIQYYYDLYLKNCRPLMYDFEETVVNLGLSPPRTVKLINTIEYMYKINIARLDMLFGEVIEKIERHGLFTDSLITFTADHGETLYRDNALLKFSHGFQLAPEDISVPLIISAPGAGLKAAVYDAVVRSVDVAPTMAGLCRIKMPQKTMGADLSDHLTGAGGIPSLPAFSHTTLPYISYTLLDSAMDTMRFLFTGHRHKTSSSTLQALYPEKNPEMMWAAVRHQDLIFKIAKFDRENPEFRPALFNLATDPGERENLFDPDNSRHQQIMDDLNTYKQNLVAAYHRKGTVKKDKDEIDREEKMRRLRSLGYI